MKPWKRDQLEKTCCTLSQQTRLHTYQSNLFRDSREPLFDDKQLDLLMRVANRPQEVEEVRAYLNDLTDKNGLRFGRSLNSSESFRSLLEEYLTPEAAPFTWNRHFQRAVKTVMARYGQFHLIPEVPSCSEECWNLFSKTDTSAGFDWITMGVKHKADWDENTIYREWLRRVNEALEVGSFNQPIILAHRTQCSGEFNDRGDFTGTCKHKDRPVDMVEMFQVLSERIWAKPLTERLKGYSYSAIGKSDARISALMGNWRSTRRIWTSLDYSHFDSSEPSWLIHCAFLVIRSAFKRMSTFESELLDVLEEDFIRKNYILSEGEDIMYVDHGNPSGSGFTAIINGICNELITETWLDVLDVTRPEYIIMGDDNIIFSSELIDVDWVASYVRHNFGVIINADKTSQHYCEYFDPEFLSRVWTDDGPYRHPNELISKMLFPERRRDYTKVDPLTVMYSYYLGYPAGMGRLINVNLFFDLITPELKRINRESPVFTQLPYNVQLSIAG